MRITALIKKVKGESLSKLYLPGDAVQMDDGTEGVVSQIDETAGTVDIEVPDNPEIEEISVKAPEDIQTPFKRV